MSTRVPRSFRRRGDYVAVVLIVVVCIVAAFTIWWHSDVRATTTNTTTAAATPDEPSSFPSSLAPVWQAESPATPEPVAQGSTVITAGGHEVIGRDPLTGRQRWRYQRSNLDVCTVSGAWSKVLALYRKGTWCSEVTSIDANTGARSAQRNGNAELGTRVVTDGVTATTTGSTLLNTWRSDLVETTEYGAVPDYRNPDRQPRSGCRYGSVSTARPSADKVAVVERCGAGSSSPSTNDRFTVFAATSKDADKPDVTYSVELPGKNATVIAMNSDHAVIALPDPSRLVVLDDKGKISATFPLALPARDLRGDPTGGVSPVTIAGDAVYWYTGSSTIALSLRDFHPLWTVQDARGPGTVHAGRAVFPTAKGLSVRDAKTGQTMASIAVDRGGYDGPILSSSISGVLLEQRGPTLVALR